jgi:microcompartment protein CcmL/EutN
MQEALGMIETRGLVSAVEAVDAMVKSANVQIAGMKMSGGALVTVMITGDVAAVSAAVEAGSTAAKMVGCVISSHVIPRPSGEIDKILPDFRKRSDTQQIESTQDDNQSPKTRSIDDEPTK